MPGPSAGEADRARSGRAHKNGIGVHAQGQDQPPRRSCSFLRSVRRRGIYVHGVSYGQGRINLPPVSPGGPVWPPRENCGSSRHPVAPPGQAEPHGGARVYRKKSGGFPEFFYRGVGQKNEMTGVGAFFLGRGWRGRKDCRPLPFYFATIFSGGEFKPARSSCSLLR